MSPSKSPSTESSESSRSSRSDSSSESSSEDSSSPEVRSVSPESRSSESKSPESKIVPQLVEEESPEAEVQEDSSEEQMLEEALQETLAPEVEPKAESEESPEANTPIEERQLQQVEAELAEIQSESESEETPSSDHTPETEPVVVVSQSEPKVEEVEEAEEAKLEEAPEEIVIPPSGSLSPSEEQLEEWTLESEGMNLQYLPLVLRFALVWLFGFQMVLLGVTAYGAYQMPSTTSLSVFAGVVYATLFGKAQLISLVLGAGLWQLCQHWEQVLQYYQLAQHMFPMVGRVRDQLVGTYHHLKVQGESLVQSMTSSPQIQRGLTMVHGVTHHSWTQKLLSLLDSLVGKLVSVLRSLVQTLTSYLPTPAWSPKPELGLPSLEEAPSVEELVEGEIVEDAPEDSTPSSSEPEPHLPMAPPMDENTDEMANHALHQMKQMEEMMKSFPKMAGPALDLSKMPPPPKNSAEMKQQTDVLLNLIKETQKIAQMTEQLRSTRGGRGRSRSRRRRN